MSGLVRFCWSLSGSHPIIRFPMTKYLFPDLTIYLLPGGVDWGGVFLVILRVGVLGLNRCDLMSRPLWCDCFLIGAADHDLVVLIGMAHHGLLVDVGWVGVARAKIHHECRIPLHRFPMTKCESRLSSIGGLVRCLLAGGFEF